MKHNYTDSNSKYLEQTVSWHVEDSPWKASQILKIIKRNSLSLNTIVEIGCGAGEILKQLQNSLGDKTIIFEGYDISPDAIKLTKIRENERLKFFQEDLIAKNKKFDLCLIIDVFEHVDNYMDFIKNCSKKAKYKIYHIPLDIHISSILRSQLITARKKVGHLHYFTKETALATLEDCGEEIIDFSYTNNSIGVPNKLFKTKLANIFRKILFKFFPDFTSKLLGGYSLIVLTK